MIKSCAEIVAMAIQMGWTGPASPPLIIPCYIHISLSPLDQLKARACASRYKIAYQLERCPEGTP